MPRTRTHIVSLAALIAVLAFGVVAASADRPRRGGSYGGQTSQELTMVLKVSRNGRLVSRIQLTRELECVRGRARSVRRGRLVAQRFSVNRGGVFRGRTLVTPGPDADFRGGRFTINGRFVAGGRRVRGVFREKLTLLDGSACDSGHVRFSLTLS